MRPVRVLLLLLLAAPAFAGDGPYDRFARGIRSEKAERRREAIETFLENPDAIPADRTARVAKLLIHAMEKDRRPELRGLAARGLAVYRSTENDVRILQRLGEEENWKAQRPLMAALTGFGDETTMAWLGKRAFGETRDGVRALWVEALGRSARPEAYRDLLKISGVRTPWPVMQAAAIALGRHPRKESVDRLIDLLWSDRAGVAEAAHESLVRLTGKGDLPVEAAAWVKWWGEHGEKFEFPGAKAPEPGDGSTTKTTAGGTTTVPTYYDIPIRGKRVVYCLDVSASMWGPKFTAAKTELARSITSLSTRYRFDVIFFNEHPYAWAQDMIPAFPFQKLDCVTVFADLETKKFTNVFDTLERALGYAGVGRYALKDRPGVDEVFLLTDGEPNRGRYRDRPGILAGLETLDPRKTVRIHTISIGEDPKELMKAIAAARGGRHVHVPAKK
ncbi:MAG: HEAT repeat domain-containing protein [Planctomycetota bacterium]